MIRSRIALWQETAFSLELRARGRNWIQDTPVTPHENEDHWARNIYRDVLYTYVLFFFREGLRT